MRKEKDLFTRVCAYVLVFAMVLICSVTGSSTEAYAGTVSVQDAGATSKMVKAKKTANVDKIVVRSKMSNVYEGQKFNETSFRKSTTVKVKKNGKVYKTTKYSIKAPVYIKANGTGKNAGKFIVKVTYGGKTAYKVMNIYKINKITVKSTGIKSLDEGVVFNKNTFKKKAVVSARYKVGKKTVVYKLPDYTVTAAAKVTANAKLKKDSFQVSIKCGKKTAVCCIPVVAFRQIKAKLTSEYTLYEGEKFDPSELKKHVSVYKTYTNSSRITPVTGFTVAAADKVIADSEGKFRITVRSGNNKAVLMLPVKRLTTLSARLNKKYSLKAGQAFNESEFRKNVSVEAGYGATTTKAVENYTISVTKGTSVKADKNGKFVVVIKYSGKTVTAVIPVEPTDNPAPDPIPDSTTVGGQEVDWLYFFGPYAEVSAYDTYISVYTSSSMPNSFGTIKEWGIMYCPPEAEMVYEKCNSTTSSIDGNSNISCKIIRFDSCWESLETAKFRIYAKVEKNSELTTYYSKILYVEKNTGNCYLSN